MQAEHLHSWLAAVTREERPDTSNWDQVVEILQTTFRYGRLPVECTWQTVVLIPKGNGEFRGIGLVEFLWKLLLGVINRQIGATVQFHDVFHGFWEDWGTGTAYL